MTPQHLAACGAATPEPGYAAAFHALTPAERDRIAQAFAPVVANVQNFQAAVRSSGLGTMLAGFSQMGEGLARARRMEAQLIAAAPRDRRPEVRRLLATLQDAPVAAVVETLSEALRFVQDPFYRFAPSGRSWAILWSVWGAIHGRASVPSLAGITDDAAPLAPAPAPILTRPCTGRPERRPSSRIAARVAANAPPRQYAPRSRAVALPVPELRGPP
jgi:hypothetical protein